MRTFPIYFLIALFLVACGGETATEETGTETEMASEEKASEENASGITLTPMPASPSFPGAVITDMIYDNGTFKFGIDPGEDGYELGAQTPDVDQLMCANSAKGQHIHLIVDNEPYAAKYEASFEHEIADGEHYILAFLSLSFHESIIHDGAGTAIVTRTRDNSIVKSAPVKRPMLFYSRPKGTYVGKDTENVMLDFYVANAELGNDYKVKVEVADQTFMVDKWQPYFLKGLGMGEHTVTLTLLDAEGNVFETPLNPVSRTITLQEDKGDS